MIKRHKVVQVEYEKRLNQKAKLSKKQEGLASTSEGLAEEIKEIQEEIDALN